MARKHKKPSLGYRLQVALYNLRCDLNSHILKPMGLFLTSNNRLSRIIDDRENPDPEDLMDRELVLKDLLSGRVWRLGYSSWE